MTELLEVLADIEHKRWSSWQKYLHSLCIKDCSKGTLTIPKELVDRWERQIETDYCDLSEKEKDSDRKEASTTIEAITGFYESLELEI